MSQLAAIKPSRKDRIIDIVEAVGIDVSEWRASGAANPKYCYQWGFTDQSKETIVLCLWYDDCELDGHGIFQALNFREYIRQIEADGGPKAARARKVDLLVQDAWRLTIPIRVAVVDESPRKKAERKPDDTSEAAFRELDPIPWHVEQYDWMTGACVLRRGLVTADPAPRRGAATQVPSTAGEVELAADIREQLERSDVSVTTRDTLVAARVGQGRFRADLLGLWGNACAVTRCSEPSMLRASHIQPWRHCSDAERLDMFNGILLTANLDALFDAGLITFDDDGHMIRSPYLIRDVPDVSPDARIRRPLNSKQRHYLAFHRRHQFRTRETAAMQVPVGAQCRLSSL